MSETNPREKLQDLVGDFDEAMLVTRDAGGTMQGRPMRIAAHDEGAGTLTFATSVESGKVAEILAEGDACVTMQGGAKYVSLSGSATISQDRARIRELWNDAWKLWFPEGPEQDDIGLIVFTPSFGEYWDQSGAEGLGFLWKSAAALVRGESAGERLRGDDDQHAETTV